MSRYAALAAHLAAPVWALGPPDEEPTPRWITDGITDAIDELLTIKTFIYDVGVEFVPTEKHEREAQDQYLEAFLAGDAQAMYDAKHDLANAYAEWLIFGNPRFCGPIENERDYEKAMSVLRNYRAIKFGGES